MANKVAANGDTTAPAFLEDPTRARVMGGGIAYNFYGLTRLGPGVDVEKTIASNCHSPTQLGPGMYSNGGARGAGPKAERLVPTYYATRQKQATGPEPEDLNGGLFTQQTHLTTEKEPRSERLGWTSTAGLGRPQRPQDGIHETFCRRKRKETGILLNSIIHMLSHTILQF